MLSPSWPPDPFHYGSTTRYPVAYLHSRDGREGAHPGGAAGSPGRCFDIILTPAWRASWLICIISGATSGHAMPMARALPTSSAIMASPGSRPEGCAGPVEAASVGECTDSDAPPACGGGVR